MTWWQWILLAIAVPVALVALGVLLGGVEWLHALITAWLFKK